MRWIVVMVCAAAVVSCGDEAISPREQARIDDEKIAAVEAAQEIPPTPVSPEGIRFPDIEKYDLFGAGCAFVPEGGGLAPIALTQTEHGWMKIDGKVERFAPDAGSAELPLDTRARYDGKRFNFTLDIGEGEGRQSGIETTEFPAQFVVRNERDQVVYEAGGMAQCGS